MLLEWLGINRKIYKYIRANEIIFKSVERVLEENDFLTPDLGGKATTEELTNEILEKIKKYE